MAKSEIIITQWDDDVADHVRKLVDILASDFELACEAHEEEVDRLLAEYADVVGPWEQLIQLELVDYGDLRDFARSCDECNVFVEYLVENAVPGGSGSLYWWFARDANSLKSAIARHIDNLRARSLRG